VIEVAARSDDVLGEGPVWDAAAGALWWVDIKRRLIHRLRPGSGEVDTWELELSVGSVAPTAGGELMAAVATGFARFDPDTGAQAMICSPEPDRTGNRFNDGGCDPHGCFWAGSMDDAEKGRTGAVYRLDREGRCSRMLDGFFIPNTLVWSPDSGTMYVADSVERTIFSYAYRPEGCSIGPRQPWVTIAGPGYPDGSAVDSAGCLWNAQIDGARLVRYTPDGGIDKVVELPVKRPTSCEFGGPDLDVLYVTSARVGLSEAELADQPLAGSLFAIDVGIDGAPVPPYAG
jgi:sugar lactone lactonase YvrE